MRFVLLFSLSLLFQSFAHTAPSSVWWPQWNIQSSEELWDEVGRKYSSYPIPLMLDGNPKIAWVYSAKSKEFDNTVFNSRFGFVFTPSTPFTSNSLRIMNGQNLNRARFFKNHRITKIRVTQELMDKKKVVTETKLSDAMGWHTVKFPRHKIKSLKIEFPEIKQSKSKNADVCISELELRDGGKKIDWRLPRAVMFLDGLEGCTGISFITHNGRELDGIALAIGYTDAWSNDGHYVAGFGNSLWVADAWRGKIVRRIETQDESVSYDWKKNNTILVEYKQDGKKRRRFLKAPNFR